MNDDTQNYEEQPTRAEFEAADRFIHELGHLKRSARTGWWLAGIRDPESVAEHSFRAAAIATVLAAVEGADIGRTTLLALFHDAAEARTGDIPSVGKIYLKPPEDADVMRDQLAGAPRRLVETLMSGADEFEEGQTLEARLAHDADRLECLAQALEYAAQGYPQTREWVQGSVESLRTSSGRALADVMTHSDPDGWWREFVARYRSRH